MDRDNRCFNVVELCLERGSLPICNWWPLLSDRPCLSGLNTAKRLWSPGRSERKFSLLLSGSKAIYLLVCPAQHTFVHYPMDEKKKRFKLFLLDETATTAYSVFAGNWYLQYRGCDWWGSHGLRHHTYSIPSSYVLEEAVDFVYSESFLVGKTLANRSGEKEHNWMRAEPAEPTRATSPTMRRAKMNVPLLEAQILLRLLLEKLLLLTYRIIIS